MTTTETTDASALEWIDMTIYGCEGGDWKWRNDEVLKMLRELRGKVITALADAWDEGYNAADINRPRSRAGHWEPNRTGGRTWIPDPLPTNPYRVVKQGETE